MHGGPQRPSELQIENSAKAHKTQQKWENAAKGKRKNSGKKSDVFLGK